MAAVGGGAFTGVISFPAVWVVKIFAFLCLKKKKDGWTECVQRKPLYLLEETKNKPPTESKYVGVNATALASVDQEKKKGWWRVTDTILKNKASRDDYSSYSSFWANRLIKTACGLRLGFSDYHYYL